MVQVDRVAAEMMISEFGQTPSQLFETPHPARHIINPLTPPSEFRAPPRRASSNSGTVSAAGQTLALTLVHIVMAAAATEPIRNALSSPDAMVTASREAAFDSFGPSRNTLQVLPVSAIDTPLVHTVSAGAQLGGNFDDERNASFDDLPLGTCPHMY